MAGKTIIEKILTRKTGREVKVGEKVWAPIDLAVVRDFGGPNVVLEFDEFTHSGKVYNPDKIAMTFDYQAPAKVTKVAQNQKICRDFAKRQGIEKVFDVDTGIGQHVLLENGLILPGSVVIGTDSHMNLLGAVNSFATGMGTTDIVAAWYTGELWFHVPETIRVHFTGFYAPPVSAKDLTLHFIRTIGVDQANYKALEMTGATIADLDLPGRLTLASMITEINGKIPFFEPNVEVSSWIAARSGVEIEDPIPDEDAVYLAEIEVNVDGLAPLIACPHAPDNVKEVTEVQGQPITCAFIGSCTNGRVEDLRAAAEILKGYHVAKGVRLTIVPATMEVAKQALSEGLYHIFMDAGAMVTNPGCSLCTIGHHGVLAEGDVLVSTSNRNFQGKLGRGADVYLASPATAAASAITGKITDPREFFKI